jgi:hypothetical protein
MKIYIPFNPFKWTIHNIIAHPLMEIFNLFRLSKIANFIHDVTLPDETTINL